MSSKSMGYVLFAIYICLTTLGMIFIKMGSADNSVKLQGSLFSLTLNLKFLLGLFFYIISFLLFTVVLARFNLSVIYPMAGGIVMVLSVLAGALLLKETLTIQNIIGAAVIVIGVVIMNLKSKT